MSVFTDVNMYKAIFNVMQLVNRAYSLVNYKTVHMGLYFVGPGPTIKLFSCGFDVHLIIFLNYKCILETDNHLWRQTKCIFV